MTFWFRLLLVCGPFLAAGVGHAQTDIDATLDAFCAHRVECLDDDETVATCLAAQPDVAKAAGVEDPVCAELVASFLAHRQCEAALPCDAFLDPAQAGCPATAAPLLELLLGRGAGACFEGRPPVDAPDGWTCAPYYFNGGVGDGCDCGCGVIDRDCENLGVVGCSEGGCNAEGCDFCYLDGDNVSCDADPPPGPGPTPPRIPEPTAPRSSCAGTNGTGAAVAGVVMLVLGGRRRRRRGARQHEEPMTEVQG